MTKTRKNMPTRCAYDEVSYDDVLAKRLKVMGCERDCAGAEDNNLPPDRLWPRRTGRVQGNFSPERAPIQRSAETVRVGKKPARTGAAARRRKAMSEDFELDTDDLTRRMEGAMGALKTEFASLRTGACLGLDA